MPDTGHQAHDSRGALALKHRYLGILSVDKTIQRSKVIYDTRRDRSQPVECIWRLLSGCQKIPRDRYLI